MLDDWSTKFVGANYIALDSWISVEFLSVCSLGFLMSSINER